MHLYFEQTTEDIYNFYVIGKDFKIYGYQEVKMVIYTNSSTAHSVGVYTIEFDDGIKHKVIIPRLIINGTGIGERTLGIDNELYIIDEVYIITL